MDIFYPKYYNQFSCIADACPNSCCKEWSVDVDSDAAAYYRSLPGALGDRLRQVLTDTEDGTIMTIENGRCPMWQSDGLCRIHKELGHDALCQVCREFPRLRHEYGTFTELGLELSCPEAARLILTAPDFQWAAHSVDNGTAEYDADAMEILLRTREEFSEFLENAALSFPQILTCLLLYAHQVQAELDGDDPAAPPSSVLCDDLPQLPHAGGMDALAAFFRELEILTPQWEARLSAPLSVPQWEVRHRALLHYFLCRYWLQAISDYDLISRVKFAIAACLLIGHLGGDLVETAQLFSKEIENDPDNVEALLDGAYTAPALTDGNLLHILSEVAS